MDYVKWCEVEKKILVKNIKINVIDIVICVINDGEGILIGIYEKIGIYILELIFGYLRILSNYDDNIKRIWGGKNGIGVKVVNIFVIKFIINI